MAKKRKSRGSIPRDTKRRLLVQAGYSCSVRGCTVTSALEFHHIDGDPRNNNFENLIVLCSNHHTLATRGQIDRKACLQIKKALSQQEEKTLALTSLKPNLRRILREELNRVSLKAEKKATKGNIFPSIFDRRRLLQTLKHMRGGPREIYLSLRVLGELRYRGSTNAIIEAVEKLRRKTRKRGKEAFYVDYYYPAVESLSKIGTKRALQWIADEFSKNDPDDPTGGLILLTALSGNENSKRYVGFRKVSERSWHVGRNKLFEHTYSIRGKQYTMRIKTQQL